MSKAFDEEKAQTAVVKLGMIGEAQTGKTSLMVKYVENRFDEDYLVTIGVSYMEKTVPAGNVNIVFSIWDLGGQSEYQHMLPLVTNDSVALLFIFDLCRKATLSAVREWYRKARQLNKNAVPILVGTKFDLLIQSEQENIDSITKQAKKFAKAMKAPLIFVSAKESININKLFKGKFFASSSAS